MKNIFLLMCFWFNFAFSQNISESVKSISKATNGQEEIYYSDLKKSLYLTSRISEASNFKNPVKIFQVKDVRSLVISKNVDGNYTFTLKFQTSKSNVYFTWRKGKSTTMEGLQSELLPELIILYDVERTQVENLAKAYEDIFKRLGNPITVENFEVN